MSRKVESQIMKITDFLVMDTNGLEVPADPHGNSLAFCCMVCGHPVLAVVHDHQRGSDEENPAICKGCNTQYFVDVRIKSEKLYIHVVGSGT